MTLPFYEKQANFHQKRYEAALNEGKKKEADKSMIEYLNYQELIKQVNIKKSLK